MHNCIFSGMCSVVRRRVGGHSPNKLLLFRTLEQPKPGSWVGVAPRERACGGRVGRRWMPLCGLAFVCECGWGLFEFPGEASLVSIGLARGGPWPRPFCRVEIVDEIALNATASIRIDAAD